MTIENFDSTLEPLLGRRPFRPFIVALYDGSRHEIDTPYVTVWRPGFGRAIFLSPGNVPVYFDHEGVVQIIDASAADAPARSA